MVNARKISFVMLLVLLLLSVSLASASAVERDRTMDFQLISSVVLTDRDGNVLTEPVSRGQNIKVTYNFALPNVLNPELAENDTYYLDIPPEVPAAPQGKLPLVSNGKTIAYWEILPGNRIKLTFTAEAAESSNQGGNFWINLGFDTSAIGEGGQTVLDFDLGGGFNQPIVIQIQEPTNKAMKGTKSGTYNPATNEITWSIKVDTSGQSLSNVIVRDMIPENTELVPGSFTYEGGSVFPSGTSAKVEGRMVTFTLGTVSSVRNVGYKTKVQSDVFAGLAPGQSAVVKNTAIVGHKDGSVHTNEAQVTVPVTYVNKSARHDPATKKVTWTVTVNPQGRDMSNVVFKDVLSEHLSYDSGSLVRVGAGGQTTPVQGVQYETATRTITANLGSLNAPLTLRYTTTVANAAYTAPTTLSNQVTITQDGNPPGTSTATAGVTTTVAGMVSKQGSRYDSARYYPHDYDPATGTITWAITINSAKLELKDPVVTDELQDIDRHRLVDLAGITYSPSLESLGISLASPPVFTNDNTKVVFNFTGTLRDTLTIFVKTRLTSTNVYENNYSSSIQSGVPNGPKNKVTLTVGGASSDATGTSYVRSNVLSKSADRVEATGTAYYFDHVNRTMSYTLRVNRNKNDLKNVVVTDTIYWPMQLKLDGTTQILLDGVPLTQGGTTTPYFTYVSGGTDASVSGTVTIHLGNITGEHLIKMTTYLDPNHPKAIGFIMGSAVNKDIINRAVLKHDGLEKPTPVVEAKTPVNLTVVQKSGRPGDGAFIDWTVTINKARLNMAGFVVADTLVPGLDLDVASLALTRYTMDSQGRLTQVGSVQLSNDQIAYNPDTRAFSVSLSEGDIIADGIYQLTFRTYVLGDQGEYRNRATLSFSGQSATSNNASAVATWQDSGGSAWGEVGTLRLAKVDEDKPNRPLAGAVFELLDRYGFLIATLTTDAEGKASYDRLRFDIPYTLREKTPAQGYVLDPNDVVFTIAGTAEIKEYNLIRENKRDGGYTNITAIKTWENLPAFAEAPQVYLRLMYYKDGDLPSTAVWVTDTDLDGTPAVQTPVLNPDTGRLEAAWPMLPVKDLDGTTWVYIVKEVTADGEEFTPDAAVDHFTKREEGLEVTNTVAAKPVTFSKTEVNGTAELPGATLQVFRGETADAANLVEEWVSTDTAKIIELIPGIYTMVETTAPQGYLVAESITFRVNLDGSVDIKQGENFVPAANATVRMEDAFAPQGVTFSKTEINGTAELPGATLQVFRGETADAANLVEEWVSADTAKVIELTPGIYTMVETTAPQGYLVAESITFRVNLDGSVEIKEGEDFVPAANATVRMEDAFAPQGVTFSKTEVNGTAELPGATLQVFRGETADAANLVEEWVSSDTAKVIELTPGIYTMVETTAPQGYLVAESITFRVNLDGSVDIKQGEDFVLAANATVRMEDAFAPQGVTFSKTEVNGTAELPGATLQVFRGETADTANLVEEWVSTDTAKVIELTPGIYTMVETTAPQGYLVAESITFRVNLDGTVEIKQGEDFVPAANATVRMEDAFAPQGVTFSKTEVNGTAELPGATLQVFRGETADTANLVEEWVSTDTAKVIELIPGIYTMVETTAPQGYLVAESITFRVNLDGTVEIKQGENFVPAANATVRMEDAFSPQGVTFSKTAVNGTAELPGASLQVFRGETADAANLVEEWVSSDTAKVIELTSGIYTMVETTAPQGYLVAESITFRVNLDGSVEIKDGENFVPAVNATVRMEDAFAPQGVTFSKTEVNGTAELPGATLQVFRGETADASNLVEEWISSDTAKVIELVPGIYTMVETTAPQGYLVAESITFRVNLDGSVDIKDGEGFVPAANATVRMEDAFAPQGVTFSKTEVNGTAELPGATLQVFKGETADAANLIEEWVSTDTVKVIELTPGVYTMVETTAPQGYLVAESITFRVNLDGSVEIKDGEGFVPAANATVRMEDAFAPQGVTFSKTEVNGTAELPGATLQVFRGETADAANLVEEWVSANTAKVIELIPGIYTMAETTAPQGYLVAESITFRVNLDGSVDIKQGEEFVPAANATVHMEDAFAPQGVTFSKTEVNGTAELPGATLQVFKGETADTANLVEEWVSTNTAKIIELTPGIYTMVETTAPQGYLVAESITFRVNLDGSVDIKQGEGFVPAANATVRIEDAFAPQSVTFSKTEVNGTAELPGATLQVFRGETADAANLVEEWVSTDTAKVIELTPGIYTMVETTAPKGYEIAEAITFRVNLDGTVDIKHAANWVPAKNATVRMQDAKTPEPAKPVDPTYPTLRVPLSVRKTLKNGSLKAGEFTFLLKDGAGRVIAEASNDAQGVVTFPDRTFSRVVKNYKYTIEEKPGDAKNTTYDDTLFTVLVSTRAVNGRLEATVDVLKNNVPYAGDVHFVNTRKAPATGDATMNTILLLVMLALTLGAGSLVLRRIQRTQEHKNQR